MTSHEGGGATEAGEEAPRGDLDRSPFPPARWMFAGSMALASAVALAGGLPLGFLAATGVGFEDRWLELVQAHGRIQLEAWAVPFVVALAYEFLPRLNERPWLPAGPRAASLVLLFAGAGTHAAGLLARIQGLALAGSIVFAAGAFLFVVLVFRLRERGPRLANPQAYFFPAAALWLGAAATLTAVSEARSGAAVVPPDESRLTVELILRGFLLNAIIAVALRAFPEHFELPVVPRRAQLLILAGLSAATGLWAAGSGALGLPDLELLRRAADLALAALVLGVTGWMGIITRRAAWTGPERFRPLFPLAWLGLVAYGVVIAAAALAGDAASWSPYEQGAVRHVFLLGFMAPLVFAMSHLVLAHFGTGSVPFEGLLSVAVLLTVAAWPVRVVPFALVAAPGSAEQALMGVAGGLALLAFALAVIVFGRATAALLAPGGG